jgi:hypothetical protein
MIWVHCPHINIDQGGLLYAGSTLQSYPGCLILTYSCVLCNLNVEELSYHLIFQCPFSYECWYYLEITWDHDFHFFNTIQKAKQDFSNNLFMKIFSMAAWEIWKQQNEKIFRGTPPSFQSWKDSFLACSFSQMYRLNRDQRMSLQSWLASLP